MIGAFALARPKLLLAGGMVAALAAAGGYVWWLNHDRARLIDANKALEASIGAAAAAAEANAAAFDRVKREHAETLREVARRHAHQVAALRAREEMLDEVENAPESDNGPVAPVLRRTLDRLRHGSAAGGARATP